MLFAKISNTEAVILFYNTALKILKLHYTNISISYTMKKDRCYLIYENVP